MEPIAIIGMACRFPHANNLPEFWQLLQKGGNAITKIPIERLCNNALESSNSIEIEEMAYQWGGFLGQIDKFDPHFFNISPREAERMDPQQRLLLEVSWEALENSGQAPDKLAGSKTGVFIGISNHDYFQLQFSDQLSCMDTYAITGNAHSIAASRLSYLLDLRGPSIAIDTACSSSLVAIHIACQSLLNQECNLAIAGGVNVLLSPEFTTTFFQSKMLAQDGQCKTFDAKADGYWDLNRN